MHYVRIWLCSLYSQVKIHGWFFLVTLMAASGNQTTMLNAGPLPAAQVVLPVGQYALYAEVYDEANAYGVYQVKSTSGKNGLWYFF